MKMFNLQCGMCNVKPIRRGSASAASHIAHRTSHMAFTLVEILVVIAIIAVLLGIGLLVGPEVIGSGNKQVTRALLNNCQAILAEYQSLVKMPVYNTGATPIDWGIKKKKNAPNAVDPTIPVDLSIDGAAKLRTFSIEQFVYATYKIESIKTKLYSGSAMQLGSTSLLGDSDSNGMLDLVDGWGNKIIYVSPSAPTKFEVPVRSFPYFASAGPDGQWGTWDETTDQPGTADANGIKWDSNGDKSPDTADNLYSYDAN